jgi:hypothetical protein
VPRSIIENSRSNDRLLSMVDHTAASLHLLQEEAGRWKRIIDTAHENPSLICSVDKLKHPIDNVHAGIDGQKASVVE